MRKPYPAAWAEAAGPATTPDGRCQTENEVVLAIGRRAFLIRHPKVADVQVIGVPDAIFGEELLAVVIPKAGEQLSEQEVRDYCKGQISHQKIPRHVQFVESYPLTACGKVQKFVLREQAIKTLGLEEVARIRTA